MKLDYEGMVHCGQNVPFNHHMDFLFLELNIFFLEDLHRVGLVGIVFPSDQNHFGIGALAKDC